jgi:hypothetical protein
VLLRLRGLSVDWPQARPAPQAVGCDLDNITPGMLHRVSRLSTRPDFAAVMMKHQGGTARPHALGALAEWVVACQVGLAAIILLARHHCMRDVLRPNHRMPLQVQSLRLT